MPVSPFPGSQALFEAARRVIPGGVTSSIRAGARPHPLYFERGEGPFLWDVDGRKYVDFALGYGPLLAVDSDPVAVEVTRANAAANGVEVDVQLADATRDDLPEADVAVANITLGAVESVLARLRARTAVTAGYLVSERPDEAGWEHVARRELDGWAADHFLRSSV